MKNEELLNQIEFEKKWLLDAGLNIYNLDIAFDAIISAAKETALEAQQTHGSTYGGVSWGGTYKEEAQPNSNEFFNFDAPIVKKSDAVSREAVLNGLANIAKAKAKSDAQKALMGRVMFFTEQLPSVTPRRYLVETSQDCISREEVQDLISRWLSDYLLDETREALETINYKIGDMPPVTPERPKGKWIKVITNVDEWGETWHFKCSICGEKSNKGYRPLENYCHNCGAEMSGGGEDEG